MAIAVDQLTKVITVPKADTTLVDAGPPEVRSYDVFEKLWKELKAYEDDEEGIVFDDTQRHVTASTLGGVSFAHQVEIVNGYTVTFEAGAYRVNLFGANHNVLDVANFNTVQLASANSAGLISSDNLPRRSAVFNNLGFALFNGNTPVVGATGLAGTVSKDGAAAVAVTGTLSEIGNGRYKLNASASDMGGDTLFFRFTATGADDAFLWLSTSS